MAESSKDSSKRGRPYSWPIVAAQRAATKLHSFIYRATGGKVAGRLFGSPVLLLITTGRKTGARRASPLLYLEDGESMVLVASNGGAPVHPAWYLNLRANPEATVEVRGREIRVRAEETSPEEKERLWPKLVAMYSDYETYRRRTDRSIPVVVLRPVAQ